MEYWLCVGFSSSGMGSLKRRDRMVLCGGFAVVGRKGVVQCYRSGCGVVEEQTGMVWWVMEAD